MSPLLAQSRHSYCRNECPLLSVKRTSQIAAAMSAYDPKQTSTFSSSSYASLSRYDALSLAESGDEAARFHHTRWRHGCRVAARVARPEVQQRAPRRRLAVHGV